MNNRIKQLSLYLHCLRKIVAILNAFQCYYLTMSKYKRASLVLLIKALA